MTRKFLHETMYRGAEALAKLANVPIAVCGAGALGSHLVDNLARQGATQLRVIDMDRVEEHNVSTQLYGAADVGAFKVDILRNRVYQAVQVEISSVAKKMEARNARKLLRDAELVVDTFDNSASRALVQEACADRQIACLHVGLNADYGEAIWEPGYRVPQDVAGDTCEYPLARNLVLLAVALASEAIMRFMLDGERISRTMTLGDFRCGELESIST